MMTRRLSLFLGFALCLAAPLFAATEPPAAAPPAPTQAPQAVPPSPEEAAALAHVTAEADLTRVAQDLRAEGLSEEDLKLAEKALAELRIEVSKIEAPRTFGAPTEADVRAGYGVLAKQLQQKGVPERVLHPVMWKLMGLRFPRVDPSPLFAQLRKMGLDPTEIEKMTQSRVRVFAKERTEVAEAQYEHLTNSLYLPPDYLEPNSLPPRLKTNLSTSELNTVIHEFDHAEKDQVYDHFEPLADNLGSHIMAGLRKFGVWGAPVAGVSLALAVIKPLATVMPWVAAGVLAATAVAAVGYGLYTYYSKSDLPRRDARQERVKKAMDGIAKVIKEDPKQRLHARLPFTESNPKSWEVSGYFMGDATTDILEQIDTIKLHMHRKIRQAKTKEELEAVMRTIEVPPSLATREFGTGAQGGSAFFRVEEINFPYKQHPELLRSLYADSLGLKPPRDVKDLVARINADPTIFPEMRAYMQSHYDRRLKEIEQAGSTASPAPAPAVDPTTPNFEDVPRR
jgi:hypothetical protein